MTNQGPDDVPTDAVRPGEVWTQTLGGGLLMILDPDSDWEAPGDVGTGAITATSTCIAVPVRSTDDFDYPQGWPGDIALPGPGVNVAVTFKRARLDSPIHFDKVIDCPSGRLEIGDAESARLVDVPPGLVRIQVTLFKAHSTDSVLLRLLPPG